MSKKTTTKVTIKDLTKLMTPSQMAKKLGLKRAGFNQYYNSDRVVVAKSKGGKLVATHKGELLKFDPMAQLLKKHNK